MNIKKALCCLALPLSLFTSVEAFSAEPPAPVNTNGWSSSAAAGLTLTRGNSDTLLTTIAVGTGKKGERNEIAFGVDATYGETTVNGVNTKNAETLRAFSQYNRLFTDRFYGYGRVEFLHDGIAD